MQAENPTRMTQTLALVAVGMLGALPRAVQVAQAAAQGLDFVLVGILLPLCQFQGFQHQFHVFQGAAQGLDDAADLFDGLLHRHR